MTPDPREERLPRWAQTEISTLRMRLREAHARLAGIDRSEAIVFVDPYDEHPIPAARVGDTVRFCFDREERSWIDVRVRRTEPDALELMASGRIHLTPSSSNLVHVRSSSW